MERYRVFASEGLDGTGKTTVSKLLAAQTGSEYYYWTDRSRLSKIRRTFDNAPPILRFLYFTIVGIDTTRRAEELRQHSDVYVDRSMVSTIAYHKALGVSDAWMALVPRFTLDLIDRLLYFTAEDSVRLSRMNRRKSETGQTFTMTDEKSLKLGKQIDAEYRRVVPDKTTVIKTDILTPQQITDLLKVMLYS